MPNTKKMNKWICLTCSRTYPTYVHLPTGCYHYHQTRELTEEYAKEKKAREVLWFNHGCPSAAMYGDDGEMQCNNVGCLIDFKRMSLEDIATVLNKKANDAS
jgi:hypothetical protein